MEDHMNLDEHLRRSRVLRYLQAGPLKDGVDLFTEQLRKDGYSSVHAAVALGALKKFALWLTAHRLKVCDIDENCVTRYLSVRARQSRLYLRDRTAVRQFLAASREGAIIPPAAPLVLNPRDQIIEGFRDYCERKRGMIPKSTESYIWFIRPFLHDLSLDTKTDLARLSPSDIVGYVERHAHDRSAATAKIMCSRLRIFLRYLRSEGFIENDLATCIISVRKWSLTGLPTALSSDQLQQVLRSCDRSRATGRRDYAVLMMLARLGLRAKEVATLTLDDIDWRAGQFRIRGKGRKRATMPLLAEVGEAVAVYLRDGRPESDSRQLFLRALAPHSGFRTASGIITIARNAIGRAGISGVAHRGSHILRHTLDPTPALGREPDRDR
jgi:site-specific recombinase XerD